MHGQGRPADGALDFSGFSTAQLRDLEYAIDRQAYPLNYHNLQLELQRRGQEAAAAPPPPPQWPVELTEHTGLRGWLEAKARGLALYGAGSVEPGAGELLLRGWRRTWLGVACRAELSVAFEKILNVAQEDRLVRFEVQQRLRRRRFEFRLESAAQASRLAALLPVTRTPAFDRDWRELHEFNVSLRRTSPHAWITPSLVALNGVVFLAMAATQRRLCRPGKSVQGRHRSLLGVVVRAPEQGIAAAPGSARDSHAPAGIRARAPRVGACGRGRGREQFQ